jgi:biotin-(acetyl-CoA carboxylase) ligase
MKNIILVLLLFVMFMGVVYGAMIGTGGTQHSDMTGKIVGILVTDNNSTNTNSILVQGVLTNGDQQGNVTVKITNETQVLREDGNKLDNVTFANLKPGQSVDITFIGPIIQGYPPQATGNQITIVN